MVLAASRPKTTEGLLAIPGIGISKVEQFGRDIFRVLRENGETAGYPDEGLGGDR